MNVYYNTSAQLETNQNIFLKKGTTLFLENENAKEHRLGEDTCATYRLLIDDQDFFNPFCNLHLEGVIECYTNPVQFGGRSYPRDEFFEQVFLNTDTNKAAIIWKHTRNVLKLQRYTAAYYLEGAMMCLYLLDNMYAKITDRVGYHARVSFRDAKGYDPVNGSIIRKVKN